MDISYGILDYNPNSDPKALGILEKCIESLAANRHPKFRSEVFLLQQGNTDPEYNRKVSSLCLKSGFHFLALTDNVGISRGINYIAQLARGDVISLVTSDVEMLKGVDTGLIGEFDGDPNIYQVTPAVNASSLPLSSSD